MKAEMKEIKEENERVFKGMKVIEDEWLREKNEVDSDVMIQLKELKKPNEELQKKFIDFEVKWR